MHKPFILLQAVLLLALSVAAAAVGMADIYRKEAATIVETWIWVEGEEPPAWSWEQVERYLWLANRLAPFDGQIQSDLGKLYKSRVLAAQARAVLESVSELPSQEATTPGNALPDASADSDTALAFFRQATALRPASAQGWADVALLKVTREEIDAEFAFAVESALLLGPWQSRVQASVAGGGLSAWTQLPAPLQTDIEQSVQRGLVSGSRLMQLVAKRFGLIEKTPAQAVGGQSLE